MNADEHANALPRRRLGRSPRPGGRAGLHPAPRVGSDPVTDTTGGTLTEFDDEKLTVRRDDLGSGFPTEWTTVSRAAVLELVSRANGHEDTQTMRAAGFVR
ncbi:hypothetical protein GCM10023215_39530 [Pseudonocardia yuanmonensis]|uniref:Uncharacterized protein n=1 Tax=Pseudonocardia yuanmonensis TaxID=1095914 RepID=A0ABP8X007_9PSEU